MLKKFPLSSFLWGLKETKNRRTPKNENQVNWVWLPGE